MTNCRRLLGLAWILAPLAAAAGCSFIDSYGAVVPSEPDSGPAEDGGGKLDSGKDTSMADAHGHVETGPGEDASDASADSAPVPQAGAIVVSGEGTTADGGLEYVLAVLDPTSGKELTSEAMTVVGIVFDGLVDQWYIFEDTTPATVEGLAPAGPFIGPDDTVYLRTRQLDTQTGKWTELGKTQVRAPYVHSFIVALNQRLAYVAPASRDAASSALELVVVDTSSPSASADGGVSLPLSVSPAAMMGTRDLTGPGGYVTFLQQVTADAGADAGNEFELQTAHVTSTSNSLGAMTTLVASYPTNSTESVGAASYIGGNANVIMIPPLPYPGTATATGYNSESNTPNTHSYFTFTSYSSLFSAVTVSECRNTAFAIATKDAHVYSVPLGLGLMPPANDPTVTENASDIRYEPYTNTALVPYNSLSNGGTWGMTFFSVSVSGSTLSVPENVDIVPNMDLRPNFIATRSPVPGYLGFDCSQH
jgi:hypothetical protein